MPRALRNDAPARPALTRNKSRRLARMSVITSSTPHNVLCNSGSIAGSVRGQIVFLSYINPYRSQCPLLALARHCRQTLSMPAFGDDYARPVPLQLSPFRWSIKNAVDLNDIVVE